VKPVILLAEDDSDDEELFMIHFRQAGGPAEVVWARNGLEAFEHLQKGLRGELPLPALVVADIKMPKLTGLELLERMRANHLLNGIPFAFLTSSSDRRDRADAARLGADLYLEKPSSVDGYKTMIQSLRGLLEKAEEKAG
jgi:two-component system response regulator